jgi:hypothetical protein
VWHFLKPGANPTIVIYNASVVKIYNAMDSPVRIENKNISFNLKKRSSLLQRWRCTVCKSRRRRIGSWFSKKSSKFSKGYLSNPTWDCL